MQWAYELTDMIHPAITMEDWTPLVCQEYLVDLETSVVGAVAALEVAGPSQLRAEQMKTRWELEPQASAARKMATDLRMKHLETTICRQPLPPPSANQGYLTG